MVASKIVFIYKAYSEINGHTTCHLKCYKVFKICKATNKMGFISTLPLSLIRLSLMQLFELLVS
jgi:hypothetical protein